ncbi:hypothetical protein ATN84_21680 [Paramesorhizobium deserti]|uniref:Uncharacterized protein n=1 Tax=Paramesorhizobium deserti TaxID=1494590 RepID=A0A135HNP8_9HYPH|nr:hypothetical protein ATN84_21680 [Paramesorhizobium deserti]
MSHDALFQLGMGSVELDATQTEEPFATRAVKACVKVLYAVRPSERMGFTAVVCAIADLLRREKRSRGTAPKR